MSHTKNMSRDDLSSTEEESFLDASNSTNYPRQKIETNDTSERSRIYNICKPYRCIGASIILSILILGILMLSGINSISRTDKEGIIKNPCGNSAAEAKALGCTWDVLSFCWLPDECLDHELTQMFREAGPWTFYTDPNKTVSVSEEEFGANEHKVYLTNELHKTHCAFNWLKFHRALSDGRMVHREDVLTHTEHCSHVLREKNEPDDIKVSALIQFPDCGYFSKSFPGKSKSLS